MKITALIYSVSIILLFSVQTFANSSVKEKVEVKDPFVRATPPGASNTALFMTLKNAGKAELIISGASTDIARAAEIHRVRREKGIMKMDHIPELKIEGGGTIDFSPEGYHIMLIGLKKTLKEGTIVPVTLIFKGGKRLTINAPVLKKMKKMEHPH